MQSAGSRPAEQPPAVEDVMHTRVPPTIEPEERSRLALASLALAVRYRYLKTSGAAAPIRQLQTSEAVRGSLRIDRDGRFTLNGGIASGRGFSGGWNATGAGSGVAAYDLSLKQLFASIRLSKRIDVDVGGLYVARGQSSEATSYDNDGYIVGERIVVRRPWKHVFDDVTITRAYLGDLSQANVFARLHALDQANYYQALVQRTRSRSSMSIDYTAQSRSHTLRSGVTFKTHHLVISDRVRVEGYARVKPTNGYGFAVALQRQLGSGTMMSAGLSRIDRNYGALNGDLYGRGNRLFGTVSKRYGDGWLTSVQIARALQSEAGTGPRTRLDVALAYDILRASTVRRLRRQRATP
jgi:hypothetical protein